MNRDEKVATSLAFSSVCFFCPSQKPQHLYQRTKMLGEVKQACSSSCIKSNISIKVPTDRSGGTPGYFHGKRDGSWPTSDSCQDSWGVRNLFPFACWTVDKSSASASTEHCALPEVQPSRGLCIHNSAPTAQNTICVGCPDAGPRPASSPAAGSRAWDPQMS